MTLVLLLFDHLKNPGQQPVLQVLEGTDDLVSWIFVIPFFFYVLKVNASIFHSFTNLACSDDFENPGRLPVSQVLDGTDDWVLRIFGVS